MCKFSMESHFFPWTASLTNAHRERNENDSAAFISFDHICCAFALLLIIIICIYRISYVHSIMQFVFNHPAHTLAHAFILSLFFREHL